MDCNSWWECPPSTSEIFCCSVLILYCIDSKRCIYLPAIKLLLNGVQSIALQTQCLSYIKRIRNQNQSVQHGIGHEHLPSVISVQHSILAEPKRQRDKIHFTSPCGPIKWTKINKKRDITMNSITNQFSFSIKTPWFCRWHDPCCTSRRRTMAMAMFQSVASSPSVCRMHLIDAWKDCSSHCRILDPVGQSQVEWSRWHAEPPKCTCIPGCVGRWAH